ncbi:DivIVA domain-containing protein [Lactobacillus sp. DCY120]|uniref:DivIVA domain-containing protein n=1 Tax=Bombilactobacillus apium TaxID=2675299 RepID=A0A850QYE5_9LACO|nr:DivIVA domain-containing protein [Bombilactobacillus apium]NVY95683.1 DivIVA domain-containing protein [Bombilactobacillus apium]
MTLTPKDIQDKNFHLQMRGYDRDEVDHFLDQIITDYSKEVEHNAKLQQQLKNSQQQLQEYEQQVSYFNELQNTVNESIIVAQNAADQVKGQAHLQAQTLMKQTRLKVQQMVSEAITHSRQLIEKAETEAQTLVQQTQLMHGQVQTDYANLEKVIQAQQQVLATTPWKELLAEHDQTAAKKITKKAQDYLDDLDRLATEVQGSVHESNTLKGNHQKVIDKEDQSKDNQKHSSN